MFSESLVSEIVKYFDTFWKKDNSQSIFMDNNLFLPLALHIFAGNQ